MALPIHAPEFTADRAAAWRWAYRRAETSAARAPRWMDADGFLNAAVNAMKNAEESWRPGMGSGFRPWSFRAVGLALRREFKRQSERREVLDLAELDAPTKGSRYARNVQGAARPSRLGELLAAPDAFQSEESAPSVDACRLLDAVGTLEPCLQRAVTLRMERFTYKEIAAQEGVTKQAIRLREQKALRIIQQLVGGHTS